MDADAPGLDLELQPEVVLAALGHGKRGLEVVDNAGLVAWRADDEEVVDVREHVDDALIERLAEQAAVDGVSLEPHDVEHLVREELEPGSARVLWTPGRLLARAPALRGSFSQVATTEAPLSRSARDMDPDPAKISMVSTRGCGPGQGGSETAAALRPAGAGWGATVRT